jgi:hypothetical protein
MLLTKKGARFDELYELDINGELDKLLAAH